MKVKISANLKLIPGGIFFVISLILLIIAFYTTINHFIKTSEWIETNATIKEINEDDETIKISYTFEKKKYSFLSEEYSSKYNIGDKFLIYVNPNNAEEVYEHDTINDLVLTYIEGFIILLISIIFLSIYFRYIRTRKYCMQNGIKKVLKIDSIRRIGDFFTRYRFYFVINLIYNDKIYKSNKFYIIDKDINFKGYRIDFYFVDEKTYFIDLDSLRDT